jgi:hypothetical protein
MVGDQAGHEPVDGLVDDVDGELPTRPGSRRRAGPRQILQRLVVEQAEGIAAAPIAPASNPSPTTMPSPSSRASSALEAPELAALWGRAGANSEGEASAARWNSAANA